MSGLKALERSIEIDEEGEILLLAENKDLIFIEVNADEILKFVEGWSGSFTKGEVVFKKDYLVGSNVVIIEVKGRSFIFDKNDFVEYIKKHI